MASNDVHAWIQFKSATFPIARNGTTSIGRSINSDLRMFEDVGVSRDHCVISSNDDRLEVADTSSRNGTRVNGHVIKSPTELRHHDVIKIGESELLILLEIDPDPPGTAGEFTLRT